MKRLSFDELYELFLSDPVEAQLYLRKDFAGYIREAKDINKLLEMLSIKEKLMLFDELNNNGARLNANKLLEEAEPYEALSNFYDFVDCGADLDKLTEKIFEDQDFELFFEGDIIDELLEKGADANKLFELCRPSIEHNEDIEEANEFVNRFCGYMPDKTIARFLK